MVQKHCKLFFFNNPSLPHTFILLMFLITFPPKNKSLQRIISEALPKMNTHTHTHTRYTSHHRLLPAWQQQCGAAKLSSSVLN